MSAPLRRQKIAPDRYLEMEISASAKHEFVDGEIYAMAGASERHNRIAGNAFYAFRSRTAGTACTPYIADMKLRIDATNVFYYPDVMLCCDPTDQDAMFKVAPCVIVEVLSPSTAMTDEREKWAASRHIAGLGYYVLVDSESMRVTWHERVGPDEWQTGTLEVEDVVTISCGGTPFPLSLASLYEGTGLAVSG
ncbi:MAG: Uma2 family endonuclease [Burkholderiales bacterium]